MYQNGTTRKELISALESLDALTSIDRLGGGNSSIHIKADVVRGKMRWTMTAGYDTYSSAWTQRRKGKGFSSLVQTLKELDVPQQIENNIVVLALAKTRGYKDYDGGIETIWYVVDPITAGMNDVASELDFKRGVARIEYSIVKLKLSEAEYKACESRLALWNEESEILYPIQPCAYNSVGRILGCEVIFKQNVQAPLASAIILAEQIANAKRLKFLSRCRTEKVWPLIAFLGKRYSFISQREFVQTALDILQDNCVYHIENWTVSDELTKIHVAIDNMNSLYQPVLEIKISDTSSPELCISAFAQLGSGRILLCRNNAYHCKDFDQKGGVQSLFNGIFEAIESFDESFERYAGEMVNFNPDELKPFKVILGESRFAAADKPQAGTYLFSEIIYRVIDGMNANELNERWTTELTRCGAEFYNHLCGENVISVKTKGQKKKEQDDLKAEVI